LALFEQAFLPASKDCPLFSQTPEAFAKTIGSRMKIKILKKKKRVTLNEISKAALNIHKSFEAVTDSDNFKYGMKSISKLLPSNRRLLKLEGDVLPKEVRNSFEEIRKKLKEIGADEDKTFESGIVKWLEEPNEYAMKQSGGRARPKQREMSLNRFFRKFKLDKNGWFKRFMDSRAYQTWKTSRDGSGYLLMTRHPIDIMKMSDHVVTNCHSEGEDFFFCAVSEAIGSNGFMVYNISDKDAQWIQENFNNESFANDEILYDKKRGFDGIKTQGMTRVRRLASKDFKNNVYTWSKFYSSDHKLRTLTERELTKFLITNQQEELEWLKTANKNEIKLIGGKYEDLSLHNLVQNVGVNNRFAGLKNNLTFDTPDHDQSEVKKEIDRRDQLLVDAIKNGNKEEATELIKNGANLNANSGQPLMFAIRNKDYEMVNLLFKYNINVAYYYELYILEAIEVDSLEIIKRIYQELHPPIKVTGFLLRAFTERKLEIFKFLAENGIYTLSILDKMIQQKEIEYIKILLENKSDNETLNLHLAQALKFSRLKIAELLIKHGATFENISPLRAALPQRNDETIDFVLRQNLEISIREFCRALEYKNQKVIAHFVNNNLIKQLPISCVVTAIKKNLQPLLNYLMKNNLIPVDDSYMLHAALEQDNQTFVQYLIDNDLIGDSHQDYEDSFSIGAKHKRWDIVAYILQRTSIHSMNDRMQQIFQYDQKNEFFKINPHLKLPFYYQLYREVIKKYGEKVATSVTDFSSMQSSDLSEAIEQQDFITMKKILSNNEFNKQQQSFILYLAREDEMATKILRNAFQKSLQEGKVRIRIFRGSKK